MAPTLIINQVTLPDADGNTPLMNFIISQNNSEVIRILDVIKSMTVTEDRWRLITSLNKVNRNGENSLILAIKYGTDEIISKLFSILDEDDDDDYENLDQAINQTDIDGNNALMCSIISGKFKHISKLVEYTENVGNHVNRNGDTALLVALKSNAPNHTTIARLLIGNARRVHHYDLPDRNGNTAKSLMTDDLKEIAGISFQTSRSVPGSRVGGIKSKKKSKRNKRKPSKRKSNKRKYRKPKH
jgi:ankyrin repeat protein